jgi:replicative DNA helicase Mcm
VRDEHDGRWSLEAGALVLADRGVACIDELDKMEENDQSALHEAMEQQEISLAKAGVQATMKTRTTVISAANPKSGRFDEFEDTWEQIGLSPALGSRFDIILTIKERIDTERDTNLTKHILARHGAVAPGMQTTDEMMTLLFAEKWMRRFIRYARSLEPEMTWEAGEMLSQYYIDLRKQSMGSIPILPRQLEGLIRLSAAFAKLRLAHEVQGQDAEAALNLHREYMRRVGVDPETGKMDIDKIALGISHSQHDRMVKVQAIVRRLSKESDKKYAREDDILAEAAKEGLKPEDVQKALETLKRNNAIYAKGGGGTWAPLNP